MQLSCRISSRATNRRGETAHGVFTISTVAILLSAISVFVVFSLWPTVPLLRRPRAQELSTTLPDGASNLNTKQETAPHPHAEHRAEEPEEVVVGKRLAGGSTHLLRKDGPVEISPPSGGEAPRGGGPRGNVDANASTTPAGIDENNKHAREVAAFRSRQSRCGILLLD